MTGKIKLSGRVLAVAAALALVVCCGLTLLRKDVKADVVASGSAGDNATWSLADDGTLTISVVDETKDGNVVMSDNFYSLICNNVINTNITSIQIGEGIVSIGNYIFMNLTTVESVSLPTTLE